MDRNKRGIALLGLVAIIAVVVLAFGAIFYYRHLALAPSLPAGSAPVQVISPPVQVTPSSTPAAGASLSPPSGPIGTVVTIYGKGFSANNTIEMDGLVGGNMKKVSSANGTTLSFAIPANLGPDCASTAPCPEFLMLVSSKSYTISVVTDGVTQTIGTFTVTGAGNQNLP